MFHSYACFITVSAKELKQSIRQENTNEVYCDMFLEFFIDILNNLIRSQLVWQRRQKKKMKKRFWEKREAAANVWVLKLEAFATIVAKQNTGFALAH